MVNNMLKNLKNFFPFLSIINDPILFINYIRQNYNFRVSKRKGRILYSNFIKMHEGLDENLENYREKKFLAIIEYARNHTIYYKDLFDTIHFNTASIDTIPSIPLLSKEIIREKYSLLLSDDIQKISSYKMNTGGSTGEPLEFLVSRLAGYIDLLHQDFVFRYFCNYREGDKVFAFDGVSVPKERLQKNIYWIKTGSDIPYGRISFSSLYLNSNTIKYYIDQIIKEEPSILRGYPSFLFELATYILQNNISLIFYIKGIQLTAENVYPWQIEVIKNAFNCNVYLQYGHSEVCVYAYTFDDTYEYYCSPFYGYVEILDNNGKHVLPGEMGEIVVTSFYNYSMPFIRYQTGDIAIFSGNQNGIVKLARIIGRTQDYVIDKKGNKISITALVFGQHLNAFKKIIKWQIQQDVPGKITIRLIKTNDFDSNDQVQLINHFKEICDIETEIEYVSDISLTKRGKFRFVVQNVL